ncbi:hypothetical protein GFM13_23520 [Rhizobium leguminosarum bv. viciae]|nr:hypothetical protein [Rhizobium leguminosarum bv. viciae]
MTTESQDSIHSEKLAPPHHASAKITAMTDSDRLRRCMKDILTITALPTTWIGRNLDYIGKTLLEVVDSLMNVDFLVLRIASREGEHETRISWFGSLAGLENASGFRHGLANILGDVAPASSAETGMHWGTSAFSCIIEKLDANGANGTLVAGSRAPTFPGDRVQLQQVIMNLLRNSIDAMADIPPTSRDIVVRTITEEDGTVALTVIDTGSGLKTTETECLFDAFHTTKPFGMGVALSVSRSIVEAHGGRIWAEPNPAGGALFGFSIPVQKPENGHSVTKADPP